MVLPCRKKSDGAQDKESIFKEAVNAAKIWEARYNATEQSRLEYRQVLLLILIKYEHIIMF